VSAILFIEGYLSDQFGSAELVSIFSHFGTVTHSVILATVDNASRRRGFVVMLTHDEAQAAMDNISQTSIRCVIVKPPYFLHHLTLRYTL
jgi:RNA recognition motif. (a.k.a. RRM, RBD, or RNP domain)